jgi:hypothetical protein
MGFLEGEALQTSLSVVCQQYRATSRGSATAPRFYRRIQRKKTIFGAGGVRKRILGSGSAAPELPPEVNVP